MNDNANFVILGITPLSMNQSKVLIVDDREFDRILYKEYLGDASYIFKELDDGEAVMSIVEEFIPDVILLDWQMPRVGGLETLKQLKTHESFRHIPVIVITGLKDESVMTEAFKLGGVDFINKPVTLTELNLRVDSTISLFKAQQRLKAQNKEMEELNKIINLQKDDLEKTLEIKTELSQLKEEQFKSQMEESKRRLLTIEVDATKVTNKLSGIKKEIVELNDDLKTEKPINILSKKIMNLERSINDVVDGSDSWDEFKNVYEKIDPEFFKKLKTLFPKLTNLDLKHCAFIKMNMDNYEVSQIMNVELKSIQMARYRLKKKLKLVEAVSLQDYILNI